MGKIFIVADVGGTHIRTACFPIDSQTPRCVKKISTKGVEAPHERLINLIASIIPVDEEIAAITAPNREIARAV